MNVIDAFAHGLVGVFGTFARIVLSILGFIEGSLRSLMKGAGLNSDVQTVVFIFIISMFLVATLRLARGRLRMSLALLLILVLAHTLETIARGSLA